MRYNLLCIDEIGVTRIELNNILKNLNINILNVKDLSEAVYMHKDGKFSFNAVIWDLNSSELDNLDYIKELKNKEEFKDIPVIVTSKFTDKKYVVKAIQVGAREYIAKPFEDTVVLQKVCKLLDIPYSKAAKKNMEDDIITFNFSEMFNKEIKSAGRGEYPLTIMLASLSADDLEKDGQQTASEVTGLINKVLKTKLRDTDSVFFYSTNSLIMLLPFADRAGAECIKDKILDIYETNPLIKQKSDGYRLITASVSYPEDGKIKDRLLEKLEEEMDELLKIKELT